MLLVALCVLGTAAAAQEVVVDGIKYSLDVDNHTATVIQGDNYAGDIVIPPTITDDGIEYTVTSIGYKAFLQCSGLTSVTIPSTVITIGEYAFCYCSSLTSVTIPSSVKTICGDAFSYTGLTNLVVPPTVESIGERAFSAISQLKTVKCAIKNNEGLRMFGDCDNLESVDLTIVFSYQDLVSNVAQICAT